TITGVNRSITGAITASGGAALATGQGGGNAGAVSITGSGTLSTSTITASGGAAVAAGQAGGNGGTLTLSATGGLTSTALAASGAAGTGTNGAGGNAGTISVSNSGSGNLVTTTLAAQTGNATGTGTGGSAGSITVNNTGGNVTTGAITTTGGTKGDGGSISVTASSGTLSVGAITSSGGAATGTANGRNAGSVSLSGAGVTTAAITAAGSNASTLGTGGNGGAVTVSSSGALNVAGAISAIGGNGVGQPNGTGGAIALTAGNGFTLANNVMTTNNTVALDAGTGTYTQNANIDVTAGSGAITVTADTVAIGTNTGNNALTTSGTLTLKAKTANRAMSLAGSSGFDVSAAEITAVSTGATGPIVIGDSTSTGTLTIGTAINLAGKTVTLNAGSITDVGVKTITASNLTLHANGQIGAGSTDGIDVAVSNLSVNTTGNANAFVRSGAVNLGASGGGSNLGSGTLDLVATGSVTQTASTGNITAGTLKVKTLSAGTANITLSNSGNDVGALDLRARNAGDTANAAGALQYSDANGFDIAALATTGKATLSAGAAVSQSGAVTVSGLALTGTGGAYTLRHAGNAVSTLAASTGSIDYSQSGALAVDTVGVAGVTTTGRAAIETTGTSANLTLNQAVNSSGSGDAVVLKAGSSNAAGVATGGQLINNVGATGIQASNGRYLVYSGAPASTQEGVSGYSKRYNSDASYQPAAGSGNLFLYRVAPTLTISVADTASTTQRVYGQASPVFSGTASGFIDGDTETSVGVTRSTVAVYNTPVGDVVVTAAAANKENYTLVLNHGSMKITPATISEVSGITANNKVVDGTTNATLNTGAAGFAGIVAGDVLSVATATGNFDSPVVGANKPVAITGISLGGAAAGNYILAKRTATTRASITDLSPVAPKQPLPTDAFITATVAPEAGASATGGPLFAIVRGGDGDWGVTSVASSPTGDEDATLGLGFWPLSLFDLSALPATAAGVRRSLAPVGPGADAGALPLRPNAEQEDARPASSNARDVRPVL
ncbi:MAG: YDG domain-containing protein, partial [Hylemonella sp.]|nr:YDG domain-containing protein [Hylemonella sp.]MDP1937327.1 YDG domain-containing protein [Hylemonella sp.]